ncbi:transglutaminase TgpA family protein [Inmirania thermothiophila]|uniref:Uncharacterized protein DUF4129 n=1 Tax=Inmirania thermothiophila TaxID=1750597 RepID=A0A3N1Y748_9GAMM|nr:DUF3488 and transglutaminase-like domain-containing protein [Inmirania thermothiophila]ROR34351.1 uncharacterized protein DUF4129 [Inmirania thermothiophila]
MAALSLSPAAVGWSAAAALAAAAVLAGTVPPALPAGLAAVALWRAAATRRGWPLPGRRLRTAAALAALAAVAAAHGTLRGLEAGSALLVAGAALKLLELERRRDAVVVVLSCALLAAVAFLHDPELPRPLAAPAVLWLLLAALAGIHDPQERPRAHLARAGALLLQALPLALVVFLFFPRLGGPLWGERQAAARTGLGGELVLGRVAELARSDAVALRVRLDGPVPAARYWRAAVFWATDGRRWWEGRPPGSEPAPRGGRRLGQTVTLLPHGQRWLPALDRPLAVRAATPGPGATFALPGPLERVLTYRAESLVGGEGATPTAAQRAYAMRLPRRLSPRVRALAQALRARGGDDRGTVQAALDWLRTEGFVYTLRPGPLGPDPVEDFLFRTRRGFCEHYAAAFALLMRAAGIPARVVVGYLGGEANPLSGDLVVRQSDAHAWVEVAPADGGWIRVDPTAAVAPLRLERAIDPASAAGAVRFVAAAPAGLAAAWTRLRDAADAAWTYWVLGYGPELQGRLAGRLGLAGLPLWQGLAALLAAGAALALAAAAWLVLARRGTAADPAQALWVRFCARAAAAGLPRRPTEGPLDYGRRLAAALPARRRCVEAVVAAYVAARYGPGPTPSALARLARAVRAFRP